ACGCGPASAACPAFLCGGLRPSPAGFRPSPAGSQTFAGRVSDLRWQGLRFEREAGGLVGDDLILPGQGEADVVVAFEQAPARVVVDLEGHGDRIAGHGLLVEVDGDRRPRMVLEDL